MGHLHPYATPSAIGCRAPIAAAPLDVKAFQYFSLVVRLSGFARPDQGLTTGHARLLYCDFNKTGINQQGTIFCFGIDQAVVIDIDKDQILAAAIIGPLGFWVRF